MVFFLFYSVNYKKYLYEKRFFLKRFFLYMYHANLCLVLKGKYEKFLLDFGTMEVIFLYEYDTGESVWVLEFDHHPINLYFISSSH
jgi:hypothetical protein